MTTVQKQISLNQTQAAKSLGITGRTLRNWEKKKIIVGHRAANGVKLYPYEKLQQLAGN